MVSMRWDSHMIIIISNIVLLSGSWSTVACSPWSVLTLCQVSSLWSRGELTNTSPPPPPPPPSTMLLPPPTLLLLPRRRQWTCTTRSSVWTCQPTSPSSGWRGRRRSATPCSWRSARREERMCALTWWRPAARWSPSQSAAWAWSPSNSTGPSSPPSCLWRRRASREPRLCLTSRWCLTARMSPNKTVLPTGKLTNMENK